MNARGMKILVVDDHRDTRAFIGIFLEILGHHCEVVGSPGTALDRAAEGAFDVLLTDVHMPGVDGWELVRRLRANGHLPPLVISMSAGASDRETKQSKTAGCHVHLHKPFRIRELESALQHAGDPQ